MNSRICAVLGAQWGDEGKGKLVDILAKRYNIIARFNGGANAGHTLVVDGKKFAFHLLPCGMLYPDKINLIGNGVVLDPETMMKELASLTAAGHEYKGRLKISDRSHLLFGFHKVIDGQQEAALKDKNIGTTKKGIGPCYASKAYRIGIRAGELSDWSHFEERYHGLVKTLQKQFGFEYDTKEELERFKQYREVISPMLVDSVYYLHNALKSGQRILAEGANAALLDVDFGTYPYVTSSQTTAGGVCNGLGLAPTLLETSIGVVKAYTTRVGAGPFPTELLEATGEQMRKTGHEFGTTTGRPRRCGWLDVPLVRYSHAINNYASINITKLDVLSGFKEIKIGVAYMLDGKRLPDGLMPANLKDYARVTVEYETMKGWSQDISKARKFSELPVEAQDYLKRVEQLTDVPISWVGVGAGRLDMATQGFDA